MFNAGIDDDKDQLGESTSKCLLPKLRAPTMVVTRLRAKNTYVISIDILKATASVFTREHCSLIFLKLCSLSQR
jgi:hypothetical protein